MALRANPSQLSNVTTRSSSGTTPGASQGPSRSPGGMPDMDGWDLQEFVMFNYDRGNYMDARWVEDELEWRES